MSVAVLRVDARLVHGQVLECWVPTLHIEDLLVVDDEAAHDALAQMAMRLALPTDLRLEIVSRDDIDWTTVFESPRRTLLLVRTIETAAHLDEEADLAGHHVPLNVGVVQHAEGRREITPAVHLSAAELQALDSLHAHGVEVEVRGLPDQPALDLEQVHDRFARAG